MAGVGPSNELLIASHGGWEKRGGWTRVPDGSTMYFYTNHLEYAIGPRIVNHILQITNDTRVRAQSVVGGGTSIYDYGLENAGNVEKSYSSRQTDDVDYLTILPDAGEVKLSKVFQSLQHMGLNYQKVHYAACRVVPDGRGGFMNKPTSFAKLFR
jgi:hypothetical protein